MLRTFPGESPEYRKARDELLEREIVLRREMEAVAELRRALPMGGEVPTDYVFDAMNEDGTISQVKLSQLFRSGSDLAVYNYMFPRNSSDDRRGPNTGESSKLDLADTPCPSCTAFIDQLDAAERHVAPYANFVVVAKTPIERLAIFGRERGWNNVRLLSSANNTFAVDYKGESDGQQAPMMNVFTKTGDKVHHFWGSELLYAPTEPGQDSRHVGTLEVAWNMFDLMPGGRGTDREEQFDYDCCH